VAADRRSLLPLPHLLKALPVQVDALFSTGDLGRAAAVVVGRGKRGMAASLEITDSRGAAIAGDRVLS